MTGVLDTVVSIGTSVVSFLKALGLKTKTDHFSFDQANDQAVKISNTLYDSVLANYSSSNVKKIAEAFVKNYYTCLQYYADNKFWSNQHVMDIATIIGDSQKDSRLKVVDNIENIKTTTWRFCVYIIMNIAKGNDKEFPANFENFKNMVVIPSLKVVTSTTDSNATAIASGLKTTEQQQTTETTTTLLYVGLGIAAVVLIYFGVRKWL